MGKGSGCFPSKGSRFVGGDGSKIPHERLESEGPSSDATKPPPETTLDAPPHAPPPSVVKNPTTTTPPAVENSTTTPSPTTVPITTTPSPAVEKTAAEPVKPVESTATPAIANGNVKVYIIYYSMYGHIAKLAKKIKEGVDSVEGVEGILFQVAETLPSEVLGKMGAPPQDTTIPIIKAAQLPEADAFLFGIPTRFGMMASQMKAFFDSTGSLWQAQSLAGKPAGVFISTGTQGGGQETTALTTITQLTHHGMLYVPIGYTYGVGMFNLDEPRGGSPYGAGTYAGDGTRMPTAGELGMAEHQGRLTANVAKLMARK